MPALKQCPAPSRVFTGREGVLRQMENYFSNGKRTQHVFVLYGLGGGGKSQTAFKFVDQSQFQTEPSRCVYFRLCERRLRTTTDAYLLHSFSVVLLVDASSDTTLTSDLANIALVRNVGKTDKNALHWLGSNRENWILILDNADDTTLNLRNYFPRGNHGNILITTRNQDACIHTDGEATCDLSQLSHEDAVALLLRVSGLTADDMSTKTTIGVFVEVSLLLRSETLLLIHETV